MLSNTPHLPVKSRIGPPLQASKWLKYPILIDLEEMESLLGALGNFWIFLISGLIRQGGGSILQGEFLDCYAAYIQSLKEGKWPEDARIRSYFSSVFTVTVDALYTVAIENQQQLIKVDKPVVQLQNHRFDYSLVDGKFRSMILGPDSIWWGIQFSYPQLYQDASMQIKHIRKGDDEFPNTALFHVLQRWIRQYTVATPFLVNEKQVNVPIRLGKNCFKWINNHPQLKEKGLTVGVY
jgi:hypothetical protein